MRGGERRKEEVVDGRRGGGGATMDREEEGEARRGGPEVEVLISRGEEKKDVSLDCGISVTGQGS
jgi:hypothetical protein